MIRSFRHKGLRRFFETGDSSGIDAAFAAKLRRQLTLLNESSGPNDMNTPNYRLHALKGGRKGQWAVWVSANWRLVFEFEESSAINVDLTDYH
jgi:proteic killer suppression protein